MQVTEVVIFAPIRDGFEVFCIAPVGDADTCDLVLFCHIYCLLFFNNGIVGELIPDDSTTFLDKTHDPLCVGICLWDLIQCIFDEIMIFNFALPLSGVVFTRSKAGMQ